MDVKIDFSNTIIETDRLILRPWEETDLRDLYEYASVEGVGEMAGWKHHESIDVSHKIMKSFISEKNVLAIEYKENKKVIGSLGLHRSWANEDAAYAHLKVKEIGYVLSKDYWGKGIMPEAVKALIKTCFEKFGLDALTVSHFIFNNQSRRVIEKCGFTFVKKGLYHSEQLARNFQDMRYILFR